MRLCVLAASCSEESALRRLRHDLHQFDPDSVRIPDPGLPVAVDPLLRLGIDRIPGVPDLLKSITMVSGRVEHAGGGFCGKGWKEWVKVSDGGPYIKAIIRLG